MLERLLASPTRGESEADRARHWTVATVNATAWESLRREMECGRLEGNDAVLIQEHRLREDQLEAAKGEAHRCGWRLDLTP